LKSVHKTYTIKSGDTLISVAKKLDIDPQTIRNYHNIHCELDELIERDLPYSLKTLLLSPYDEAKSIEKDLRHKVRFGVNKKFLFKPSTKKINYGVMYTMTTGDEVNTLKYEVSVKCVDKEPQEYHLLEIDRISKVYINDEEANAIADEIAEKVSSILYPLVVVVNKEGVWQDIYNYWDIAERWKKKKQDILEEYEGEQTQQYIATCDHSLENRANLKYTLNDDLFLNAFFSGIYVNYTEQLVFENTIEFPLLDETTKVEYAVEQKIEKYIDEYNHIIIEQNGLISDQRTKIDFENKNDFPLYGALYENLEKVTGNFRSIYFLKANNYNTIETAYIDCDIELDVPQKLSIVINEIEENLANKKIETKKGWFF
jgi:phage anti-repressor protein